MVLAQGLRLQSSEGFIETGGPTFKVVHSHGFCQEVSIPHYRVLSIGVLECPSSLAAGFRQSKGKDPVPFMT